MSRPRIELRDEGGDDATTSAATTSDIKWMGRRLMMGALLCFCVVQQSLLMRSFDSDRYTNRLRKHHRSLIGTITLADQLFMDAYITSSQLLVMNETLLEKLNLHRASEDFPIESHPESAMHISRNDIMDAFFLKGLDSKGSPSSLPVANSTWKGGSLAFRYLQGLQDNPWFGYRNLTRFLTALEEYEVDQEKPRLEDLTSNGNDSLVVYLSDGMSQRFTDGQHLWNNDLMENIPLQIRRTEIKKVHVLFGHRRPTSMKEKEEQDNRILRMKLQEQQFPRDLLVSSHIVDEDWPNADDLMVFLTTAEWLFVLHDDNIVDPFLELALACVNHRRANHGMSSFPSHHHQEQQQQQQQELPVDDDRLLPEEASYFSNHLVDADNFLLTRYGRPWPQFLDDVFVAKQEAATN